MPSVINSVIFKNVHENLNGKFYTLSYQKYLNYLLTKVSLSYCCDMAASNLFINKTKRTYLN